MSYDVSLLDPVTHETLLTKTNHMMFGGTYEIGGTQELWLSVTYNYGAIYRKDNVFGEDGIKSIDGMTGAESISVLKKAIDALGNDVSSNYWDATEGNAKSALTKLLAMAQMRPDGIWEVC